MKNSTNNERGRLLYLDDLRVEQRFASGSYALDEEEIKAFAAAFDPQAFHLDGEAARETLFGGLAASGWHTAAITMRLQVDGGLPIAGGIVGAGGEISWPKPTRPGDILHVESELVEITPSRSRPDRGIVTIRSETLNQRGEVVQILRAKLLVHRRPVASRDREVGTAATPIVQTPHFGQRARPDGEGTCGEGASKKSCRRLRPIGHRSHWGRANSALAIIITALSLSACKPAADNDPRKADHLVQIATVEPVGDGERTFTGVVAARVQSDLGFRVQGKVVQRLVDTGQVVHVGQLLMRIDPADLTLAIAAQAQAVAAARAREIQATADEARDRKLLGPGAVSTQEYEQAKAAADSARALLSAAEAQEKVARNQGDYSLLLADADGIVVETLAEPGQVVAQGQIVVRLAHAGPREASVDLPETIRPKLGSAALATLYGDATRVSAHLRQLSDAAEPRTRTYEARYVLDGDGAEAPLGATVKLTLVSTQPTSAVQVPIGAIDDEGKGPGVWVVDGKSFTVAYRPVQVDQFGSETAVLSGGVRPGEQIAAMGGHLLREGERVRVAGSKAAMQ